MKNPKTRFIYFTSICVLEIIFSFYYVFKHNINVSWDEFFPGPLFLNLFLALSFAVNAFQAYRIMQKVS